MKPVSILLLFLLILTSCHREANQICTLSGKADQYDAKEWYLTVNGQKDTLRIGEEGTFSVEVACEKPADAVIQGESVQIKIILEPGGNHSICSKKIGKRIPHLGISHLYPDRP